MMDYSKAITCAILSQEVYGDFPKLRFSRFSDITPDFVDREETGTQCAIFSDVPGSCVYIVFRGSQQRMDWEINLQFKQEVAEFKQEVIEEQIVGDRQQVYPYAGKSTSGAMMHQGFSNAYTSVRDTIHTYLKNHTTPSVTVTGHSLGGALATLCAVDIQYNFPKTAVDVYTFGAPRVGNDGFRESFNRRVPNSYRFVHGMDIVPAIPRPWQGYRHVDAEYRLGRRFSWNFLSQRFKDHAIAKYIEALKEDAEKTKN